MADVMWFGNRNNFSHVIGLTHLSWFPGLFWVYLQSPARILDHLLHSNSESARLGSSGLFHDYLHWRTGADPLWLVCGHGWPKPSEKRTMLRVLLNQEETTQELQYGQLFTRKGLSCVNWQWGPAWWRCPVQRREEQRRILNRRAVRREGTSRSDEQAGRAGPDQSGSAFTRLRLGPPGWLAGWLASPLSLTVRPTNWFWKVLENLKCWLLVF